jgi:hypothetical protein
MKHHVSTTIATNEDEDETSLMLRRSCMFYISAGDFQEALDTVKSSVDVPFLPRYPNLYCHSLEAGVPRVGRPLSRPIPRQWHNLGFRGWRGDNLTPAMLGLYMKLNRNLDLLLTGINELYA